MARILICDTSIPFAGMVGKKLREKNASVALVSVGSEEYEEPLEGDNGALESDLSKLHWKRHSQLSAKTLLLQVKNLLATVDSALILFDAQAFLADMVSGQDSLPALLDDYVNGYMYLVREVSSLFLRQKKGQLFFSYRPFPPRTGLPGSLETVFAVAESAFIRLAEESAAYFASLAGIPITCQLVRLGDGDDTEDAAWFAEKLASAEYSKTGILGSIGARSSSRWIKAGSRNMFGIRS